MPRARAVFQCVIFQRRSNLWLLPKFDYGDSIFSMLYRKFLLRRNTKVQFSRSAIEHVGPTTSTNVDYFSVFVHRFGTVMMLRVKMENVNRKLKNIHYIR